MTWTQILQRHIRLPPNKPMLRHGIATKTQVRVWPDGAVSAHTDWEMFRAAASQGEDHVNVEEHCDQLHCQMHRGCDCD